MKVSLRRMSHEHAADKLEEYAVSFICRIVVVAVLVESAFAESREVADVPVAEVRRVKKLQRIIWEDL